jgi:hypothetical protein
MNNLAIAFNHDVSHLQVYLESLLVLPLRLVLQHRSKPSQPKLLRRKMFLKLQFQLLLRRRLLNVSQKEKGRKMLLTPACSLMMCIRWRKQKNVRLSTNQKLGTGLNCLGIFLSMCMAHSFLALSQNSFNSIQCILLCIR